MKLSEYDIRHVAIYLRKSRGQNNEEIDDLAQHRAELIDMCTKNQWSYVEYAEIGSGDKIELRPKMVELLQDVEQKMYDAVLAVHFDRLSRGDEVDQATIKKTLARSETLFIASSFGRVYDYNNDQDILVADMEGMMARLEYKTISRRFRQGKARRAKEGYWSNGVPPFPYIYNRETGKAEPHEGNTLTYRKMIEMALNGYSSTDIAWELNKLNIPSPRDQKWSPVVVRRLICDEVHLGRIVVGKKRKLIGSGDIVRKPKTEWIVHHNCHKAVKTLEEHEKIMFLIVRDNSVPVASRSGANVLSSIVRCAKCGHTLQIQKRTKSHDLIKSCTHRDPYGIRCTNFGGSAEAVELAIKETIFMKKDELIKAIEQGIDKEDIRLMIEMSEVKLKEIKKIENRLNNLTDMRADGEISKDGYAAKKAEYDNQLSKLEEDYNSIQSRINSVEHSKNEDMLLLVENVIESMSKEGMQPKELNRLFKSIIYKVNWNRDNLQEQGSIEVNFL